MITLAIPSGIGDISWMYSKLCHVKEPIKWLIADGWPYRSREYLELLAGPGNVEYDNFRFDDIVSFEATHGFDKPGVTWEEISGRGFGITYLEANRHLEAGKPLCDWLPDLPINYHYDIPIDEEHAKKAARLLEGLERPITCVSPSSLRGSEAWKTWGYQDWSRFLKLYQQEIKGTIILVGGFWDDMGELVEADGYRSLIGKTHIATMISILGATDLFVGFSNGLGVLRTVLRKPAFMLWPDHQIQLSTSWVPPDMLEDGTYARVLWRDPDIAFRRAQVWLRKSYGG